MLKLSMLALVCFISLSLFHSLASLIVGGIYGLNLFAEPSSIKALMDADAVGAIKFLTAAQQVGFFLVPAIVFARLVDKKPVALLNLGKGPSVGTVLVVCALIYASAGTVDFFYEMNMRMQLPEFLSGIEEAMLMLEREAGELTELILKNQSVGNVLINIAVIGLIPALGEELLFRGLIQKYFSEWSNNKHVGVWLAAMAFSFMHMQFYGFLPRMLLGAMFGYLLLWTGNLWVPIVAHFLNNALVVIFMYFAGAGGMTELNSQSGEVDWTATSLSITLTAGLLYVVWRRGKMEAKTLEVET